MQFDCTLKREGEATHATRRPAEVHGRRGRGEKPKSLAESECRLQVLRNSDARVFFPLEKLAFSVPRCTCGRLQDDARAGGGSDALLGMDNTGKKRLLWQRAERGGACPEKLSNSASGNRKRLGVNKILRGRLFKLV